MKKPLLLFTLAIGVWLTNYAQNMIPLDTAHWEINANSYVLESILGTDAIYLQGGAITYKGANFLNGTIEYDVLLKQEQAFPGVFFRVQESGDAEHFYVRPHLPGKPDANQAAPVTKGLTPWQLYFGPRYSFPYPYQYDDWTHIKILVAGDRAQVYLDHSSVPHLSWDLFHPATEGQVYLTGGNRSGMHLANIVIDHATPELIDFAPIKRKSIPGLIQEWEVSDKFQEKVLDDPAKMNSLIENRSWNHRIQVEEGTAANISRAVQLGGDVPGNTVFTRITIYSDKKQTKRFHFGYSDRVVAVLNGEPIYRGNNNYRSRDYRYLGTVGLFDSIYLPLKKGENTLLMAVSENFGGWLITGKFEDETGIEIR